MAVLETNLFSIENLADLVTRYRLWRIVGLRPDHSEYYQNCQQLQRLSFTLRQPVQVVERNGEAYLAVPEQASALPAKYPLVRTVVEFEALSETLTLDYVNPSPENEVICLRFLRFLLQSALRKDPRLWQPRAGQPFFERVAESRRGAFERFTGFSIRPITLPDQTIGVSVDPTSTYVAHQPLSAQLTRDEFNRRWKGSHCICHFGDDWYDIKLEGFADRNVSRHRFIVDKKEYTLLEYILQLAGKPISRELAQLPHDCSVVFYRDSRGQERAAPTALCYPVLDTNVDEVGAAHGRSLLPPHVRHFKTSGFVSRYLRQLEVAGAKLSIAPTPIAIPERRFDVPDALFGNQVVLSIRGTTSARHTTLDRLGHSRLSLLRDHSAGFFSNAALDRHYIFLPRTIHDSCGPTFIEDLRAAVHEFLPGAAYAPSVVPYEDHGPKTFAHQGRKILEAAQAAQLMAGYGVAMIHPTANTPAREEDQLAAMVIRRMRELHDLRVGVIHTEVAHRCYAERRLDDGRRTYVCSEAHETQLKGYIRNVALNHVLLANQRWPFVLASPLHADLTIGIDVKHHTCGLIAVSGRGDSIRTFFDTSRQKEQLTTSQFKSYLARLIREESNSRSTPLQTIVLHRDGRIWPSERAGAEEALRLLRTEGVLTTDASVTVLEIAKSTAARLRLFALSHHRSRPAPWVDNPEIGTFYLAGREAFLCTTGRAFPRPGTVRPLHVKFIMGAMSFEDCLQDLFALTTLAWTRPQDCARYPITMKLNDRFLRAEAGEYDTDALQFEELSEEEESA